MDEKVKELIQFEILEQEPQKVVATMLVHQDLPSLAGHFPGNPILPAISIIDISLYLLSLANIQVSHSKINVKRSKFMGVIRPQQEVHISAESDDGVSWKVLWSEKSDKSRLALVNLTL